MGILSDVQIVEYIKRGELVLGADEKRAIGCAYEFTVERIFQSGPDVTPIDWKAAKGDEYFVIKPGSLVWVRMKSIIKLPNDICAFWWQTNTSSRQGLMLVNMSTVAPGYTGPLACLFVNFGKEPIRIGANTTVARLIFVRLERMTNAPFPPSDTVDDKAYDGALHEVALRAPLSFLNLTELSRSLETEFADLSNKLEAKRAELAQQLSATAETIRVKQKEDMRTDLWALIRASFVYAVLGLVVLILATQAVPWIQGLFRPNLNDIVSETVEHQLSERFLIPGTESLSSRDAQRALENLINEAVKRQLAKRFPPAANSSAASSATKTAPSNNTPAAHPTNRTAGNP